MIQNSEFPLVEGIENDPHSVVDDLLEAGIPAFYAAPGYPETEYMVRVDPDRTKTLIRFSDSGLEEVKTL